MLTRIEVEKTYWLGMSTEQKQAVIKFLNDFSQSDITGLSKGFDDESLEAMDDMRKALLNA